MKKIHDGRYVLIPYSEDARAFHPLLRRDVEALSGEISFPVCRRRQRSRNDGDGARCRWAGKRGLRARRRQFRPGEAGPAFWRIPDPTDASTTGQDLQ